MTTDQKYQQIYRVGGMLDAGFVGQITYTISLDQVYDELDIHFSFDKRLYSENDVTPELLYTKEFTSDGCLAQNTFSGVLKVTVLVFNVLLDNTQYTLTVSGHPVGQGVIAPNFNLMDTVKTGVENVEASDATCISVVSSRGACSR